MGRSVSFSEKRKISPQQDSVENREALLEGLDNCGIEIGPTKLALDEWKSEELTLPDLKTMRTYRLNRIVSELIRYELAGVLLFDPLNIRYATDTTNMQLWNTHNPFRACLVMPNGHMVIWDYKNSPFLSKFNPLVKEVRSGASMFYFASGDKIGESAQVFSHEVSELLKTHCGKNRNLAVDKIMISGLRALEGINIRVSEGERIMEYARSIKGKDEILAMKCALSACEKSVEIMEAHAKPGLSENEVWSFLHSENIKRGGEWIETRLLTSGPRTNPWFQECGPRIIKNNEVLAFDTDLIGCYGICADISRTWWIGNQKPREDMICAMNHAYEHIMGNMELLKPGVSFKELTFKGHQLDEKFQKLKYSCKMHGVGLCDEWPLIAYPDQWVKGAYEYSVKPGMVFCVEALVSEIGKDFSIKLEDQVVITEDGYENLTAYPFDRRLMGDNFTR